jgi:hypothetical protein
MRDSINAALTAVRLKVSGAHFTKAGNIAITPHTPSTVSELLRHGDLFGGCIAHGQTPASIAFETDKPWISVVATNVHIPQVEGDIWKVEQLLCEELGAWNLALHHGVKNVQIMCRPEDIFDKDRRAVRISFDAQEDVDLLMRKGIFAYGEHCRVSPYRVRRRM